MAILVNTNFQAHGNCYIWGLANPTTGDIVATLSGAANSGMALHALLLNGSASQGAAAADFSSAGRTSVSVSVGSVATDLIVDYLPGWNSWTPGGSQTLRTAKSSDFGVAASSTLPGSAGSTSMSWSGGSAIVSLLAVAVHGM